MTISFYRQNLSDFCVCLYSAPATTSGAVVDDRGAFALFDQLLTSLRSERTRFFCFRHFRIRFVLFDRFSIKSIDWIDCSSRSTLFVIPRFDLPVSFFFSSSLTSFESPVFSLSLQSALSALSYKNQFISLYTLRNPLVFSPTSTLASLSSWTTRPSLLVMVIFVFLFKLISILCRWSSFFLSLTGFHHFLRVFSVWHSILDINTRPLYVFRFFVCLFSLVECLVHVVFTSSLTLRSIFDFPALFRVQCFHLFDSNLFSHLPIKAIFGVGNRLFLVLSDLWFAGDVIDVDDQSFGEFVSFFSSLH